MSRKGTVEKLVVINIMALVLAACGKPETAATQAPAPQAPTIDVSPVISQTITDWDIHTGRLQAPETVVLIPRVSGYIEQVNFAEGALVQAGEVLFQIDPRPFEAEVQRLKAELRSVQSAHQLAGKDYARAEQLQKQGAISDEIVDTRYSTKQQALAKVLSLQAALDRAQLDLEFTRVTAPISGRLSYAQVTAGNYVTAGETRLTTLVSTERMYAYFDVDEATYLDYSAQSVAEDVVRQGGLGTEPSLVYMGLANEQGHEHRGYIDFVDNSVNEQTGTIRLRATFNNDDGRLVPGLFARIKMAASEPYQAVLINEKAVGTDLNNKYVLVLNPDNKVEYRPVTLGEKNQGLRVVKSGLAPGDTIVVNGLQRIYPNTLIEPNEVAMAEPETLARLQQQQRETEQDALAVAQAATVSATASTTTLAAALSSDKPLRTGE